MNVTKKDVNRVVSDFLKVKLKGKTFEQTTKFKNRSLWWFVRMSFLNEHIPFRTLSIDSILDSVNNPSNTTLNNVKRWTFSFLITKLVLLNEVSKWIICKLFGGKVSRVLSSKKRVMFLAHSNALIPKGASYEVDRVERLRKAIDKDKQFQTYISSVDPFSRNSFLRLLKFPNPVYNHISWNIISSSWSEAMSLSRKKRRFLSSISLPKRSDNRILKALDSFFDVYLSFEFIFLILVYQKLYEEAMSRSKINYVFFYATTDLFSRCALSASEELKIPAASSLHGVGLDFIEPEVPKDFTFFVSGQIYKDKFLQLGLKPSQLKVSGSLFLSEINKYRPDNRKHNRVLFFTTTLSGVSLSKDEYFDLIKKIFLLFSKYPKTEFVVKPHPNENHIPEYQKLVDELGLKNVKVTESIRKSDLYNLINSSDFLVSFGSTVAFEALILKKPGIVMNIFGEKLRRSYIPMVSNDKAFVQVKSFSDLESSLSKAFSSPSFFNEALRHADDLINMELSFNDDKAPDRIFSEIKKRLT